MKLRALYVRNVMLMVTTVQLGCSVTLEGRIVQSQPASWRSKQAKVQTKTQAKKPGDKPYTPPPPTDLVIEGQDFIAGVEAEFKKLLKTGEAKVIALRDFTSPSTFSSALKNISFLNDTQVQVLDSEKDGFFFDWGYTGLGPVLGGFGGFETQLIVGGVPEFVNEAIKKTIEQSGLAKLITFSPAQEWVWKEILLANDLRLGNLATGSGKKRKTAGFFGLYFNMLIYKLIETKTKDADGISTDTLKYPTFSDVTDDVSPIITKLIQLVPLKINLGMITGDDTDTSSKKQIWDFLAGWYSQCVPLVTYHFSQTYKGGTFVNDPQWNKKADSTPLNNADSRLHLLAILMRTMAIYEDMKTAFAATPAGKKLLAGLEEDKQKYQALIEREPEEEPLIEQKLSSVYSQKVPGMGILATFVGLQLTKLLARMKDATYRNVIESIADPVLGLLHLPKMETLLKATLPDPDEDKPVDPPKDPPAAESDYPPIPDVSPPPQGDGKGDPADLPSASEDTGGPFGDDGTPAGGEDTSDSGSAADDEDMPNPEDDIGGPPF